MQLLIEEMKGQKWVKRKVVRQAVVSHISQSKEGKRGLKTVNPLSGDAREKLKTPRNRLFNSRWECKADC